MPNAIDSNGTQQIARGDIAWAAVWTGFAIALLGTLAAGTWAFVFAGKGTWWAANIGTLCLFCGAVVTGFRARTAEPLNGAFIAVFYFGTAALAIFSAEFLRVMPDPLPGLPRGDSTFFFVWPLEQLAASTLGAMLGGWLRQRKDARGRDENLS
ncbi:MAG: hypothetical protein WD823_13945 [Sulfuricaulis sp.]|uniref:hypothetical protein n=1 Tax=Sulfuricaulis sp. TaxID=2003553 RepID=UPI0034A4561C